MKTTIKILMILTLAGTCLYGQSNSTPPPTPSQEEPEALNQGPIHESYAQPVEVNPQTGIVAPNEPPPDIKENPSMERPQGSEYVWIPGYWSWDAEGKDYIWVSGCWRVPPAGMSWIPGYWNATPEGWQWVAGFWTPTSQANQIEYLPEPPEITDIEPPINSIITDEVWVPPCYYWQNGSYLLRSGYWLTPNDNWIWTPSHYTWTPYGYVFVPGYWDRTLARRGILYAPYYFPRRFHIYPGYTLSLGVVVDIGNLQFSLFSYPRYCHYYFGDYYSDFYLGIGIYPWFDFGIAHNWYCPIYVHDRWRYRRTIPHWGEHIRHEYSLRRDDRNLRPPRTYRDFERRFSKTPERERRNYQLVEPLNSYVRSKRAPFKFSRMNNREHERILSRTNEVNNFRQERRRMETRAPEAMRRQGEVRAPERTIPEVRTPERATPERRAQERATPERKTPEQAVPEQRAQQRESIPQGRSSEQMRSERPSMRSQAQERQRFSNRSSSERRNFPRSPVTGRSSQGFFGLRRRTPSRPDGERNFERGGGNRNRESRGGRERR
jgi:hypothetical protein